MTTRSNTKACDPLGGQTDVRKNYTQTWLLVYLMKIWGSNWKWIFNLHIIAKYHGHQSFLPLCWLQLFSPGKFHGQRSLVGYSPGGHKELETTEHTDTLSLRLYFLDSFGNDWISILYFVKKGVWFRFCLICDICIISSATDSTNVVQLGIPGWSSRVCTQIGSLLLGSHSEGLTPITIAILQICFCSICSGTFDFCLSP